MEKNISWGRTKAYYAESDKLMFLNGEERYRITAEQTGQMVYDYDPASGMIRWDGAVETITGFKKEAFRTSDVKSWFDMIHPDDLAPIRKLLSQSLENFVPFNTVYRLRRKTGEYIFIEEHGVVLPASDGRPCRMLGTLIDVTERLRVEKELRRKEEDLRVTLGSIGDAVIATDIEGRVVMMNAVAEKKTGWKSDESIGKELCDIFRIGGGEAENPAKMVFSSKDIVHMREYTTLIARDGSQCLISDSAAPIHNDSGDIVGSVIVFRDVTEEKSIRDRLRQSEKMDAVGQLAGGVAHDFNNMLCGILGAAEVLTGTKIADDPETKEFLDVIIDSSNKAADLTNKLLSFSRQKPDSSERIDVMKPLNDAIALIERTMDKRIRVKVRTIVGELIIMGNNTQLQNAFLNLLINATHAMPDGGEIMVNVSVSHLDKYYCESSAFRIAPGDYADIEIMDTGSGISPENLPRIFEPFFTTKGEGRGTGLGLSSVYGTVKQHDGAITVYSEVGKGTVFHIYLPAAEDADKEVSHNTDEIVKGMGRILLMDDEESIRVIAKSILGRLGYEIVLADNGKDALDKFSESPGAFDLVILDMMTPEMNGRDCFLAMKSIRPDVRVILSSGFVRDEEIESMKAAGLKGMIQKPYNSAKLSRAVHDALNPEKS